MFLAESGSLAEGVTAAELLVYEWPPASGDRWFLQEQLCEFLGIKSFKRRYPDVPAAHHPRSQRTGPTSGGQGKPSIHLWCLLILLF